MNSDILDRIQSLPPLPESVHQLRSLFEEDEIDLNKLVQLIESDPLLSANMIKSANSPFYGFTREIRSIRDIVLLMGPKIVRGFAISMIVHNSLDFDLCAYGVSSYAFSKTANLRNALAHNWYKNFDPNHLPELQTAAFLMEAGKIIISHTLKTQGLQEEFHQRIQENESISLLEKEYFNFHSYDVTAELFRHWNFEFGVIDLISCVEKEGKPLNDLCLALITIKDLIGFEHLPDDTLIKKALQTHPNPASRNPLKQAILLIQQA